MTPIGSQFFSRVCVQPVTAVLLVAVILPMNSLFADETTSFRELRQELARSAIAATREYLEDHPQAEDATEAYRYLFETALAHGLVSEANPLVRTFLDSGLSTKTSDRSLARKVAMVALALEGDASSAIEVLGEELIVLRRIDPSAAIDAATSLAAAVQRGGKPEMAKDVYERLERSFFLNPTVGLIVENRLARLELLGQPLPELSVRFLDGQEASANTLTGKVVLIDFWATNCPPCLEELPELKQLYADLHDEGFEIIGVSLDEDESTVRGYLEQTPLPWPLAVSSTDNDATRERFKVETIPANFLIGRDGNVNRVDLHGPDLRFEVERLLKERQ